jgi:tripartite-type tricarboxylate transporter receptor subunit TctC
MKTLTKAIASAAFASTAFMAATTFAQNYPSRTVTLVVPFAAGGISDSQSRQLAQRLSDGLGQPVVVVNQPGASGMIGTEAVARAAPDGHTMLYGTHGTHAANLALFKTLRVNPPKDLRAVHSLFKQSTVLVTSVDAPYRSLEDLVQAAKREPGKINYASAGSGTQTHLAAAKLEAAAGITLTHIPYKGAGPALMDVLGRTVDITFSYTEAVTPQIQAGKLRALALAGQNRLDILPGVPTAGEAGYPDAALEGWSGIFVPAGTPDDVVAKLAAAIQAATESPKVLEDMARIGSLPMRLSDKAFQAFVEDEVGRWKDVVEQSGARLE